MRLKTILTIGGLLIGFTLMRREINLHVACVFYVFIIAFVALIYLAQEGSNKKDYRVPVGLALVVLSVSVILDINMEEDKFFRFIPSLKAYITNFVLLLGGGVGGNILATGIMNSKRQK